MAPPVFRARLRWLTAAEGGRKLPFAGPVYAATAHFGALDELFSVVLRLPAGAAEACDADLSLLAPENLPDILKRLVPGSRLFITEGPRTVAEARVLTLGEPSGLEPR